jgi:flagellin
MSLSINNNITALNAWRNLKQTDLKMSSTMEKLSSGLRINRGADDPAGLVISEKMRAQLTSINSAIKNSEKAINLISTAEAALDKTNELLTKMRQLVIDTGNLGVTDQSMAKANQQELDEIVSSITRIGDNTQFGTKKLIDGTHSAAGMTFQIGANGGQTVNVKIEDMRATALAASGDVDITGALASTTTLTNAHVSAGGLAALKTQDVLNVAGGAQATSGAIMVQSAITIIDQAIDTVSEQRGKLGAIQADNLEVSLDSLRVSYENLQAAESTIRDADMTAEMAEFTKYQIMMQAGTAMLAQANQMPNNILQLLR